MNTMDPTDIKRLPEIPETNDRRLTVEQIELLSDVRIAIRQIDAGEGLSNRDAKAELRRRFRH
jgi:hypothetical protein